MCCGLERLGHRAMSWFGKNVSEKLEVQTQTYVIYGDGRLTKFSQPSEKVYFFDRGKPTHVFGTFYGHGEFIRRDKNRYSFDIFSKKIPSSVQINGQIYQLEDRIYNRISYLREYLLHFDENKYQSAMRVVKNVAKIAACALAVGAAVVASKISI